MRKGVTMGEVFGRTELDPKDLKTIDACKTLVGNVFEAIAQRHGNDEAARIFSRYGRRTKREVKLESDVMLLWKCDDMKPNLNVRQRRIPDLCADDLRQRDRS